MRDRQTPCSTAAFRARRAAPEPPGAGNATIDDVAGIFGDGGDAAREKISGGSKAYTGGTPMFFPKSEIQVKKPLNRLESLQYIFSYVLLF